MTVIFHTNANNIPTLLGDLLISGTEDQDTLKLPGHREGITDIFPKGSGFVPIKIKRKVFIINDHIAVGISGTLVHMRAFIKDLKEKFHTMSSNSFSEIHEFINIYSNNEHGRNVLQNIHALILLNTSEKTYFFVAGEKAKKNCSEKFSNLFGESIAIGSGQKTVLDEIERVGNYQIIGLKGDPIYQALVKNLTVLSQIHQIDSLSGKSLIEYWGGGYEMIYLNRNRKFQYLNEYTMTYWTIDLDEEESTIEPFSILRYERNEQYSVIFTHEYGKSRIFGCTDITERSPVKIEGKVNFNSGIFINTVLATRNGKVINMFTFADKHEENYIGTVFTEINHDNNLVMLMQSNKQQEISAIIHQATTI